jgi:hypothetical protein
MIMSLRLMHLCCVLGLPLNEKCCLQIDGAHPLEKECSRKEVCSLQKTLQLISTAIPVLIALYRPSPLAVVIFLCYCFVKIENLSLHLFQYWGRVHLNILRVDLAIGN